MDDENKKKKLPLAKNRVANLSSIAGGRLTIPKFLSRLSKEVVKSIEKGSEAVSALTGGGGGGNDNNNSQNQ